MSTFLLNGYFALGDGRRISAQTARGSLTYFNIYNTTIQCLDGVAIPAEMRFYSPPNNNPFPDNTIVHASARAYLPPGSPALLDGVILDDFHGSADDDSFMDSLPDTLRVTAFGIGTVQSKTDGKLEGSVKSCTLEVFERVRDKKQQTPLHCTFAGNPIRWANVPMPNVQSPVFFFGTCASLAPGGTLSLELEHITFNALAPAPVVGGAAPPSTPSPSKRRKLDFRASPSSSSPASSTQVSTPALPPNTATPVHGAIVQSYPPVPQPTDMPIQQPAQPHDVPPSTTPVVTSRPKRKAAA